jgi:WD40 repeat protein
MFIRSLVVTGIVAAALVSGAVVRGQTAAPGLDLYGDPLPAGALLRLGTTRLQTKGGFAWLPDGKSLVTLKQGKVTFWDMTDGRAMDSFYVPVGLESSSYDTQLTLSRDGKRLVCTDTKGAIAVCSGWDAEKIQTIATPGDVSANYSENLILVMLPDGQTFITLRRTGELEFRDVSTMAVRRTTLLAEKNWHTPVPAALSPDGKILALGDVASRSLVLVDTDNDREPAIIAKATKGFFNCLAFLPDGRLVVSGSAKRNPPEDGKPAFQAELRLWDVSKKEAIGDWPVEDARLTGCGLGVSTDGRELLTVYSDRIYVWDIKTQTVVRRIEDLSFRNAAIARVETDPSGKYIAVDDHQNFVRIWDHATGNGMFGEGEHQQGHIGGATWSPDGSTTATGGENDVFLWDASTGKLKQKIRGPAIGAWGLQFANKGNELIICGNDPESGKVTGLVKWYEPASGRFLRQFESPFQARMPALSPNGSLLAFSTLDADSGHSTVQVVNTQTGEKRCSIDGAGDYGTAWSNDGQTLFATSIQNVVTSIHVATQATVFKIELPHQRRDRQTGELAGGRYYHAKIIRNGERALTSGSLPEIYVWDLTTGRKQLTIPIAGFARALAVTPDETVVACVAGSDKEAKLLQLFDISTQRKVAEFNLGLENSQCLAFSPDGRRLLVGFPDGTALVMDVAHDR